MRDFSTCESIQSIIYRALTGSRIEYWTPNGSFESRINVLIKLHAKDEMVNDLKSKKKKLHFLSKTMNNP